MIISLSLVRGVIIALVWGIQGAWHDPGAMAKSQCGTLEVISSVHQLLLSGGGRYDTETHTKSQQNSTHKKKKKKREEKRRKKFPQHVILLTSFLQVVVYLVCEDLSATHDAIEDGPHVNSSVCSPSSPCSLISPFPLSSPFVFYSFLLVLLTYLVQERSMGLVEGDM